MDKERIEASRALGHLLPKIAENHNGGTILPFLASDSMSYVMGRLVREVTDSHEATLAVYWPETQHLDIVTFESGPVSPQDDACDVNTASSIGMVIDAARNAGGRFAFRTSTIMGGVTSSVSQPLAFV